MSFDTPISTLFTRGTPLRSLEFFPPKDDAGVETLKHTAQALVSLKPDFVSVTYGAGGSTRERTAQVSTLLRKEFLFTVMPHLTCVGHSKEELTSIADKIYSGGFRNIMALRGDPPKGSTEFVQSTYGLRYGSELVSLLKSRHPEFCLGVGGYPEKHPEAASSELDIINLKKKVDAGADFITTQLFYDNNVYFSFVERCRKAGITIPIVPGILPVLSLKQVTRFTALCGASLPAKLVDDLTHAGDDMEAQEKIGTAWALYQIKDLLKQGAPGYHLYIMNRAKTALALTAGLAS
jgi:methylenetetrahydrofolate reductase (NADPH)